MRTEAECERCLKRLKRVRELRSIIDSEGER